MTSTKNNVSKRKEVDALVTRRQVVSLLVHVVGFGTLLAALILPLLDSGGLKGGDA
jgi:hypothetical protein